MNSNLPATLLLIEVDSEAVEAELRNSSTLRTWMSVGVGEVNHLLRYLDFLFELQEQLVLAVEHHDVVVVDNAVTLLSVLVSWVDDKSDAGRSWVKDKLNLERVLVIVGEL